MRLRGMTGSSKECGVAQQPFAGRAYLVHFVLIGHVLVIADHLAPELPDALAGVLNLPAEARRIRRPGGRGMPKNEQLGPGAHVMALSRLWPDDAQPAAGVDGGPDV